MNDIEKHPLTYTEKGLFTRWKQELLARAELREKPLSITTLSSVDECELMYRALYFTGRRYDYFCLLFDSLDNWVILKWLSSSVSSNLIEEFLEYVAWKLCTQTLKPPQLQFLINIYNSDYQITFNRIFCALNIDQCQYLAARTANSYLRELIKKQEEKLLTDRAVYDINLLHEKQSSRPYPTIYGDKIQLLQEAARRIHNVKYAHYSDPSGQERFNAWLETCDLVFRCGLLEDAFLMLKELYEYYQERNRIASMLEDGQIYKSFVRLTRSLIPCLVLLHHPHQAVNYAVQLWDRYFKRLTRDIGSLHYLTLYESITEGLKGHSKEILWEILYKCDLIRQYRPQDRGLLFDSDLKTPIGEQRVQELLEIARERILSRPHETLTLLGIVRLLHNRGLLQNHQLDTNSILDIYNDLWQWVPSKVFINKHLLEQLLPILDRPQRRRAERLAEAVAQYDYGRIKQELTSRPHLFMQKDAWAQREILLGHILGVLS